MMNPRRRSRLVPITFLTAGIVGLCCTVAVQADVPRPSQDSDSKPKAQAEYPGFEDAEAIQARVAARKEELPRINGKLLDFALKNVGKTVGNGECTDLVIRGLRAAGAHPNIGYVFGRELKNDETVLPGDVVQFTSCRFETPQRFDELGHPNHTAIVYAVDEGMIFVLHQNYGGKKVIASDLQLDALVKGSFKIYRPAPRRRGR